MASHTTDRTFLPPAGTVGVVANKTGSNLQETQETKHLPAVLGMRDLTVLLVLIVLFVPNILSAQSAGPAAFLYWVLALFTFLLPSAFVIQWLARRFPGQGAPYFWAIRILGAKWSFLAAFCAWWPGAIAIIATAEVGIYTIQYLAPAWFTMPAEHFLLMMAVLLVSTAAVCLPLRWLKQVLLGFAALYYSFYVMLGIAGGWWLWSGHAAAVPLHVLSQWQPNSSNFAVYGLLLLGSLGVDMPLLMGGEIRGGKTGAKGARHYVWWGVGLLFLAYVAGTFGIMVIVPPGQAGAPAAGVQAIQMAFGSLAGSTAAIVLAFSQIGIIIAYLLAFSRLLIVFSQDRQLATPLTRVNRHGVPVLSIVVQAVVVASLTIVSYIALPRLLEDLVPATMLPFAINSVLSACAAALWEFSTALLFFCAIGLCYRHKRWRRTSGGQKFLLLSMSIIGIAASLIGIWATLAGSWIPTLIPDDDWLIIVAGVILVSLALGWVGSEVPRVNALLGEQRRANHREVALRGQLQEAYDQQQVLLEELDQLYREQARAAVTDAVTGLPNHRAIMSRIDEELARCQRVQSSCAMLFVDLDHFKHVNDTCGHRVGDTILHEVAHRLRTTLRLEDFVGRYGGEEFAILLTDANVGEASQAAERLRIAVAAQPCLWQAEDTQPVAPIAVTASIGVAVYQLHGVTREALIEAADRAMYAAKHEGRNRVCLADMEMAPAEPLLPVATREQTKERVAVQALIAAATAHDRSTSAHAQRLTRLVEATARKLGRPEEELQLIRLGALLHDIGKIGIPEAILHKPGPLTEEEWAIMRRHPDIGRQILEQVGGIFHLLSRIIVAHHERWDGQGYPHGLAKEEIPMSARILALVDSYDAMTSDRPYRAAMPVAEARAELQRCAGRQYDPQVVEAFLCVLDEEDGGRGEARLTGVTNGIQLIESAGARFIAPEGKEAETGQSEQEPARP